MEIRDEVGHVIRVARVSARMTQAELAERLNIAQNTVSGWESGRIEITLTNLFKLSGALGIPVTSLLGEQSEQVARREHRSVSPPKKANGGKSKAA